MTELCPVCRKPLARSASSGGKIVRGSVVTVVFVHADRTHCELTEDEIVARMAEALTWPTA